VAIYKKILYKKQKPQISLRLQTIAELKPTNCLHFCYAIVLKNNSTESHVAVLVVAATLNLYAVLGFNPVNSYSEIPPPNGEDVANI
tara:strand:+ start:2277 stop:2537 length:261 start_codon:yes stop_codon:yes gene_type:complete